MVVDKEKVKELIETNIRLKKTIDQLQTKKQIDSDKQSVYHIVRFVQVVCIGVAVFGGLWKGTEIMNLDTPEFMIVYGTLGAIISEVIARIFKKKMLK